MQEMHTLTEGKLSQLQTKHFHLPGGAMFVVSEPVTLSLTLLCGGFDEEGGGTSLTPLVAVTRTPCAAETLTL